MLTTNCNTLNAETTLQIIRTAQPLAAAARLCDIPDAIYLTTNGGDIGQLHKLLAETIQKRPAENNISLLPTVLSFANFVAAAEVHSAQIKNSVQLINTARLISPPHRKTLLTMDIYNLLRQNGLDTQSDSEVLAFARSLAGLFVEFVQNYPKLIIPENALPELLNTLENSYRRESEVIKALWQTIYDGDLFAARRPNGLLVFAQNAPPIIFVDSCRRRPLWCDDFLQQCVNSGGASENVVVYENDEIAETTLWENIINDNGEISPPENIQQCWQGKAASLHQTANIALAAVREFTTAENASVGIVIYNRLLARRLRAVAETNGVLIQDDGGWRMETLSFGGALRQWVRTVATDFSPDNFIRLLAPPYWQNAADKRAAAEESWRDLLASEDALPHSWRDLQEFAKHRNRRERAIALLGGDILAARQQMPANIASLSAWMQWLLQQAAAALAVWQNDPAATKLRGDMQQAATAEYNMTAAEFCAWLDMFMSDATGGDSIKSKICFVSPTTTAQFDSLILLGATADNLPTAADVFFGEKGRKKINLRGRDEHLRQQFMQFWNLLATHPKIAAVWQESDKGEVSPSPFWTVFTDMWKQQGKEIFPIPTKLPFNDLAENIILPPPPLMAKTILQKFPPKLSITATTRLMQCPYHFYMKDILLLREKDGEETIGPAALGRLLHRAMKEFITTDETDEEALRIHWQKVFGKILSARRGVQFAREHWRQLGDSFIREESALRSEGWRPTLREHLVEESWQLGAQTILLRGRLDRADCKSGDDTNTQTGGDNPPANSWAIVDYKSGEGPSAADLKNGEDPQLPLYAFLLSLALSQPAAKTWRVAYPTKPDKKTKVEDGDAARIAEHLQEVLTQIADGKPMPANGSPAICRRCESRRLCRREHWQPN